MLSSQARAESQTLDSPSWSTWWSQAASGFDWKTEVGVEFPSSSHCFRVIPTRWRALERDCYWLTAGSMRKGEVLSDSLWPGEELRRNQSRAVDPWREKRGRRELFQVLTHDPFKKWIPISPWLFFCCILWLLQTALSVSPVCKSTSIHFLGISWQWTPPAGQLQGSYIAHCKLCWRDLEGNLKVKSLYQRESGLHVQSVLNNKTSSITPSNLSVPLESCRCCTH